MGKNQAVADTSRAKKAPLKGSQTKKNRKSASGSAERIVIVNDDELETAAVLSNGTESENGDLRGSEQEEDDAEEYENGDIEFLCDEKTSNTDEKKAEANSNGNGQKTGKNCAKTRGNKKENQSERVVNKSKSKAGTSQQTTNAQNSKAKKNANHGVELTKNGKNEKEKKLEGNKGEIFKSGKSSSMKKNEKSSTEESKANTKNTPRKGKSNGDAEKMKKGKERVEEDEEVSVKVAKKAKGSSTSGDKSPSSTEKNGKKEKEKKSEGNKDVILKTGKTSSMKKNEESGSVESNGNTKGTPRKGKSNGDEEKMQKRKDRVEEDEEVSGKVAKKAKGSSTSCGKSPSKTEKNGPIKKKENLAEENEEGRGTVVAKKVKSNGQTRGNTDTVEKKDIKDEKKVENGETKVSQSNRKTKDEDEQDGDEEDVKCESTLYKFPMSRIARIIKSEVSDAKLSQEATFVINKATEKFLDLLCKEAYACAFLDHKPYVGYDHLSSAICKRKRFEFLSDFVPERIKAELALADLEKLG
ncbi:unnamed protein product [Cuscuta europaea]|uniref:Transcription factor CBF/NF-Y/archaeal histone domain-containing protein n=1 Tax=Cuscuta europaea TaxID=41803 RepID=A0A9P1E293_CUSEU|nr:unnamed protein product [Cuscuta europaea]